MSETKRNDAELLQDMIEAIEKAERYTENMNFSEFSENDLTVDAVARNFSILGEAAGRLDKEKIIDRFPEVQWRNITGFRHKIVHDYFAIDARIVWEIIVHHLPALKTQINQIIQKLTNN